MSESEVLADLARVNGNKSVLMQSYSDQMAAINKPLGGSPGDVPVNPDHPYHKLQHKLTILGRMK